MNIDLPQKVFLESTALYQLGSRLQKPELAELLERRELVDFELAISNVSWLEFVRQRIDIIDELATDLGSVMRRLREWNQDSESVSTALSSLVEFRSALPDWYAKKAEELKIKIVPTPPLEPARLLEMSIGRVAPFEESKKDESEKGFRDSLIMFSILEEIRNKPELCTLVITGDKLLTKGLHNHESEFGTKVNIVASFDEAREYIDKRVSQAVRSYLAKQSELAKETLEKYRTQIAEEVSHIRELTDMDLGVGPVLSALSGSKPLSLGESVEKVNSLTFSEIESAVWKDTDKSISRILFRIGCTATVVVNSAYGGFLSSMLSDSTRYVVGGGKSKSGEAHLAYPTGESQERALAIKLYGEAQFAKVADGWELVRIKVDRTLPQEDMVELARIK
jgi:hypothetical protein